MRIKYNEPVNIQDISAGDKVKCVDTRNIYIHSNPDGHLKKGNIYTVRNVVIHNWFTDLFLEGFARPFNSCIFCQRSKLDDGSAGKVKGR